LENITYLANFSQSTDKVKFLQKKTDIHKKTIKQNINVHKETIQVLKSKVDIHVSQIEYFKNKIEYFKNKIATYHTNEENYLCTLNEKKDIIAIYKDTHKTLQDKTELLMETIRDKNNSNKKLVLQNKTLEEKYTHICHKYDILQCDFTQLIEQYTHSNESRGSLENVNDSLQVVNNTLSVQLNEIYINLLETQEDLDKHKHKTIWDILFNKIK